MKKIIKNNNKKVLKTKTKNKIRQKDDSQTLVILDAVSEKLSEFKNDILAVVQGENADLRKHFTDIRVELKEDINSLRTEFKEDINSLRTDLSRVEKKIDNLTPRVQVLEKSKWAVGEA
jgi:hypothetical protein